MKAIQIYILAGIFGLLSTQAICKESNNNYSPQFLESNYSENQNNGYSHRNRTDGRSKGREYMMSLKENNPDEFYRLMELKETDRNQFRKELRSIIHKEMKCRKENRGKEQFNEIISKYNNASSDSEKEKIREKIRNMLDKDFDKRQKRRSLTIERLNEKLEDLKKQLEAESMDKNQFISKQLDKMLNQK
jgi:hypothetical protein